MTNAVPKFLTALAAVAFLAVAPVSAQTTSDSDAGAASDQVGGGQADVVASQELDTRVAPEHRATMYQSFRGLNSSPWTDASADLTIGATVPGTAVLHPVPDAIIATVPDTRGYRYFSHPDGRIFLVHPEDNTVAMILEN